MNELHIEAEDQTGAPLTAHQLRFLQNPAEDLEMSVRSYNYVKNAGIRTVAELAMLDELGLRFLNDRSMAEIKETLGSMGLSLGTKIYDRSTGRDLSLREILTAQTADHLFLRRPGEPVPFPHVTRDLYQELEHVFRQAGYEKTEWPLPVAVQVDLANRLRFARAPFGEPTKG